MYKCQICGSRTCPACLDCKSLGERKTGYYCNKYKVKLRKLAYSEQYSSTIELLHSGAMACNYCLIDRGRLPEETIPTLGTSEEDDEEPFTLPDTLPEEYYLRYTPPNPESRITNQDILDALETVGSTFEGSLRQRVRVRLARLTNDETTSTTITYSTADSSSTTASH